MSLDESYCKNEDYKKSSKVRAITCEINDKSCNSKPPFPSESNKLRITQSSLDNRRPYNVYPPLTNNTINISNQYIETNKNNSGMRKDSAQLNTFKENLSKILENRKNSEQAKKTCETLPPISMTGLARPTSQTAKSNNSKKTDYVLDLADVSNRIDKAFGLNSETNTDQNQSKCNLEDVNRLLLRGFARDKDAFAASSLFSSSSQVPSTVAKLQPFSKLYKFPNLTELQNFVLDMLVTKHLRHTPHTTFNMSSCDAKSTSDYRDATDITYVAQKANKDSYNRSAKLKISMSSMQSLMCKPNTRPLNSCFVLKVISFPLRNIELSASKNGEFLALDPSALEELQAVDDWHKARHFAQKYGPDFMTANFDIGYIYMRQVELSSYVLSVEELWQVGEELVGGADSLDFAQSQYMGISFHKYASKLKNRSLLRRLDSISESFRGGGGAANKSDYCVVCVSRILGGQKNEFTTPESFEYPSFVEKMRRLSMYAYGSMGNTVILHRQKPLEYQPLWQTLTHVKKLQRISDQLISPHALLLLRLVGLIRERNWRAKTEALAHYKLTDHFPAAFWHHVLFRIAENSFYGHVDAHFTNKQSVLTDPAMIKLTENKQDLTRGEASKDSETEMLCSILDQYLDNKFWVLATAYAEFMFSCHQHRVIFVAGAQKVDELYAMASSRNVERAIFFFYKMNTNKVLWKRLYETFLETIRLSYQGNDTVPIFGFLVDYNANLKLAATMGRQSTHVKVYDSRVMYYKGQRNDLLNNFQVLRNDLRMAFDDLDRLERLNHIDLSSNLIVNIHSDSFSSASYQENLTELILQNNLIEEIDPIAFSRLKNLVLLDLSLNFISCIDRYTFSAQQNLKILNLSHNLIRNIDPNSFFNLRMLLELHLEYNNIDEIPLEAGLFEHDSLEHLTMLNLAHNSIAYVENKYFYKLVSLKEFYLNSNRLEFIRQFAFDRLHNLQVLSLSMNRLKSLGLPTSLFFNLADLRALFLDGNRLYSIHNGLFKNQGKLEVLFLNSNKLYFIEESAFANLISLRYFFVFDNDLTSAQMNLNGLKRTAPKLKIDRIVDNENKDKFYMSAILELVEKVKKKNFKRFRMNHKMLNIEPFP